MDYNRNFNSHYHQYKGNISKLFHNSDTEDSPDDEKRFKISEIDNPNGWSFSELDMLDEMGFVLEDDYTLTTEVDTFALSEMDISEDKQAVNVYKSESGYTLESQRKYVFETFNKMIGFLEGIESDINM